MQRNAYCPFFANLTVSSWRLPGASVFVFLPPILKSCEILPLLMTVKITVPVGTRFFENVYLNSNAFTVTFEIAAVLFVASTLFVLAPPDGQEDTCEHTGQRQRRQS